jgi:hypothetical protein
MGMVGDKRLVRFVDLAANDKPVDFTFLLRGICLECTSGGRLCIQFRKQASYPTWNTDFSEARASRYRC